jgi:hypothetical protein
MNPIPFAALQNRLQIASSPVRHQSAQCGEFASFVARRTMHFVSVVLLMLIFPAAAIVASRII